MLTPRDVLCLEATDEVRIDVVGQAVKNNFWIFVIELTDDFPATIRDGAVNAFAFESNRFPPVSNDLTSEVAGVGFEGFTLSHSRKRNTQPFGSALELLQSLNYQPFIVDRNIECFDVHFQPHDVVVTLQYRLNIRRLFLESKVIEVKSPVLDWASWCSIGLFATGIRISIGLGVRE